MSFDVTLNIDKTKLMVFCSQSIRGAIDDIGIDMDGVEIERVQSCKYLAITLDQCITFDQHIKNTYDKCCGKLGAIYAWLGDVMDDKRL